MERLVPVTRPKNREEVIAYIRSYGAEKALRKFGFSQVSMLVKDNTSFDGDVAESETPLRPPWLLSAQ
jgi:hypothetical protein